MVKFRGVMADWFAASRLATFTAAAAKCTAGEVVGANDGYYYYEPSHFGSAAACSCYPVFVTVARIVIVFVLVVAVAYYYGKYVGKAQRNTTGREVVKEKKYDDYDGSWQKISLEVNDASCECKLLAEPLVYSIEEVRDIACQSQVTYKRKLIQPRFVPTPFCDGAFPEPTRTKIL